MPKDLDGFDDGEFLTSCEGCGNYIHHGCYCPATRRYLNKRQLNPLTAEQQVVCNTCHRVRGLDIGSLNSAAEITLARGVTGTLRVGDHSLKILKLEKFKGGVILVGRAGWACIGRQDTCRLTPPPLSRICKCHHTLRKHDPSISAYALPLQAMDAVLSGLRESAARLMKKDVRLHVLYGPSGVGKSTFADAQARLGPDISRYLELPASFISKLDVSALD